MKFKTKKELAERLMNGERWRVIGNKDWCFYNEDGITELPFKVSEYEWKWCDGETEWEQDIPKNIITIEKWLCRDVDGEYYTKESSNLDAYKGLYKIKLLDSYEVEIEGE